MDTIVAAVLLTSAIGCVTDLRARRIPNVLTFGSAAVALAYHSVASGWSGLALAGAGWIVGVFFFAIPFLLGGMGGGDVKLVAALGAWLGPTGALWLGLYTGVAGGAFAVVAALSTGYLKTALTNMWSLFGYWRVAGFSPLSGVSLETSAGPRLAYAIPIAAGAVVTLWLH